MKEGVESLMKFKKLKRRLGLPEWQVVGLLESIWKLARTSAQDGAIGKHSNEDIAAAMEYQEDADCLVACLVETGWLDEDPEYRLVIHDWSDHVPTYLKGNFAKHNRKFADVVAKQRKEQPAKQCANSKVVPNPTKPNLPPKSPKGDSARKADVEKVWEAYQKYHPKKIFDVKRKRMIQKQLKEGHSVERLIGAIHGCHANPFNLGQNENNKTYLDLEHCISTSKRIEHHNGDKAEGLTEEPKKSNYRPPTQEELQRFKELEKQNQEAIA